ncbi:MAG: hypothetical protein ACRDKI_11970 [Solirubrobacterales bacterium]
MEPELLIEPARARMKILVPLLSATVSVWSLVAFSVAQAMIL